MSQEEVTVFEPDFRVKGVDIENFRGFEKLELEFHPQLTVLIGENGAGKTAILDCLVIATFLLAKEIILGILEEVLGIFEKENQAVKQLVEEVLDFFLGNAVKQGTLETKNSVDFLFEIKNSAGLLVDNRHYWIRFAKNTYNGVKINHNLADSLNEMPIDSILLQLQREPINFPIFAYYPITHAPVNLIDFKKANESKDSLEIDFIAALKGLLKNFDFISFFSWYKWQENIEKQIGENKTLNAIREAIYKLLSDNNNQFDQLHINWLNDPNGEMLIQKNQTPLNINQLSAGEKTLLTLVADLARRLAIANPHREKPLEGYGVVLIDEIDLHLHPRWQRKVVPQLRATFPNCQWIVTTHSPHVLSQVDPENVFILKDFKVLKNTQATYGRDANSILSDIMEVSPRPEDMQQRIEKCFDLIDDGELEAAKKLLTELSEQVGANDPDIVYGYSLVNFMSEE